MNSSSKPGNSGPQQLNLVNSSRLTALRQKASTAASEQSSAKLPKTAANTSREDAETARLRAQIQQQLTSILSQLPAGRQQSLFKIRYGVTPEQLLELPVKQAAALLKISPTRR